MYCVYGGALRQLARCSEARWAFFFGLQLAEKFESPQDIARICQKLIWLEAAEGDFNEAGRKAQEALAHHAMLDDCHGIGRILVDQGILYSLNHEFSKARFCFESSLRRIPFSDTQYLFTVHHELALSYWGTGDQASTFAHIEKARHFIPDNTARSKVLWFEAQIRRELGEDTCSTFEEIVKFCLDVENILDAVLATAELVNSYLRSGRLGDAIATGRSIKDLAFSLDSRLAATAAMEIYRSSINGSIELRLVQEAIQKISKAAGHASRPAIDQSVTL